VSTRLPWQRKQQAVDRAGRAASPLPRKIGRNQDLAPDGAGRIFGLDRKAATTVKQGKATRSDHMPMLEQGPGNQRPLGGVQATLMHKVKTPGIFFRYPTQMANPNKFCSL
jgi:hypothetical protein